MGGLPDRGQPRRGNRRILSAHFPDAFRRTLTVYHPKLLPDVLSGRLDPSLVLDPEVDLEGVPAGYAAMDGRPNQGHGPNLTGRSSCYTSRCHENFSSAESINPSTSRSEVQSLLAAERVLIMLARFTYGLLCE